MKTFPSSQVAIEWSSTDPDRLKGEQCWRTSEPHSYTNPKKDSTTNLIPYHSQTNVKHTRYVVFHQPSLTQYDMTEPIPSNQIIHWHQAKDWTKRARVSDEKEIRRSLRSTEFSMHADSNLHPGLSSLHSTTACASPLHFFTLAKSWAPIQIYMNDIPLKRSQLLETLARPARHTHYKPFNIHHDSKLLNHQYQSEGVPESEHVPTDQRNGKPYGTTTWLMGIPGSWITNERTMVYIPFCYSSGSTSFSSRTDWVYAIRENARDRYSVGSRIKISRDSLEVSRGFSSIDYWILQPNPTYSGCALYSFQSSVCVTIHTGSARLYNLLWLDVSVELAGDL